MPRSRRARRQASRARESSSSGPPVLTSTGLLRRAVTRSPAAAQSSPAAASEPNTRPAVSRVAPNATVGARACSTAPTSRKMTEAAPARTGTMTVTIATTPAPGPGRSYGTGARVPADARFCSRTFTKWSYSLAAAG